MGGAGGGSCWSKARSAACARAPTSLRTYIVVLMATIHIKKNSNAGRRGILLVASEAKADGRSKVAEYVAKSWTQVVERRQRQS